MADADCPDGTVYANGGQPPTVAPMSDDLTNFNPGLTAGLIWTAPIQPSGVVRWHDVARVLSDTANGDVLIEGRGQEQFAQAVAMLARLVPYGDDCDSCTDRDPVRWPVSIEVSADRRHLEADYHCHVCGHEWRTSWAMAAPLME